MLRSSITIALHQDGRNGYLAVRFCCCDADLRVSRGVLGIANLAQSFSLSALGMQRATMHVLQSACTLLQRPPFVTPSDDVDTEALVNA